MEGVCQKQAQSSRLNSVAKDARIIECDLSDNVIRIAADTAQGQSRESSQDAAADAACEFKTSMSAANAARSCAGLMTSGGANRTTTS